MPRPDFQQLALRTVERLLEAAFDTFVGETPVQVTFNRPPAATWPAEIPGLDPEQDGPWPRQVDLLCQWRGGSAQLRFRATHYISKNIGRSVALQLGMLASSQELLWINLSPRFTDVADDTTVPIEAWASIAKRQDEAPGAALGCRKELITLVEHANIIHASGGSVPICEVHVPSAEISPLPRDVFAQQTAPRPTATSGVTCA